MTEIEPFFAVLLLILLLTVILTTNFFFLCMIQFIPPFKKTLKTLIKLSLLFLVLFIIDPMAEQHFFDTRAQQADLDGDEMFSNEESQLKDHEFWFKCSINDTGENFKALFAPVTSVIFSIFIIGVYKLLMHFSVTAKIVSKAKNILNTGQSVNGRNIALSLATVVAVSIAFFEYYFRTGMNVDSLLKIHDYEQLMLWSFCVFCVTAFYYFIVTKFFPFEFLFKLYWIKCVGNVFRYMYNFTFVQKTDSFLYMLVPLAGLIPAVIIYADNLLEKLFTRIKIKEKISCICKTKHQTLTMLTKKVEKITSNVNLVSTVWAVLLLTLIFLVLLSSYLP